MGDTERHEQYRRKLTRIFGSAPWLKTKETKRYRVKLFKSGNSIAVRIPAEIGFKAGMEMELEVENGQFLSLEPIDAPKRKFNIAKVAGSATSLRPIRPEERIFQDSPLVWPDAGETPHDAE